MKRGKGWRRREKKNKRSRKRLMKWDTGMFYIPNHVTFYVPEQTMPRIHPKIFLCDRQ